jgi:hypothetical protein
MCDSGEAAAMSYKGSELSYSFFKSQCYTKRKTTIIFKIFRFQGLKVLSFQYCRWTMPCINCKKTTLSFVLRSLQIIFHLTFSTSCSHVDGLSY